MDTSVSTCAPAPPPAPTFKKRLKRVLKPVLRPILGLIGGIGFDPTRVLLLRFLPRYLAHARRFREQGGTISAHMPIFVDWQEQAGTAGGHYFHQDLLVATRIHDAAPRRHIDVGSRVDGFVAHVASFRNIELLDVRALQDSGHPRIQFMQADLMDAQSVPAEITDSLSCLHVLEHFGLGRYGDAIEPNGHRRGFNNLLRMLEPGGTLYVSFPIGRATEVHFNAHRVFHPTEVLTWADTPGAVELLHFDFVDDQGALHRDANPAGQLPPMSFGCGIYTLRKRAREGSTA
ncbi:MAG: hypothetical protein RI988_1155 [Pseudomonadota bacterium]|jgi:hypothetical protein